ncbi:hypothetical protein CHUAL_000979, partial [Chamberlinius hualienensis]
KSSSSRRDEQSEREQRWSAEKTWFCVRIASSNESVDRTQNDVISDDELPYIIADKRSCHEIFENAT